MTMADQLRPKRGAVEDPSHVSKKQRSGTGAFAMQPRQDKRDPNPFANLPDHVVSQIFSHLTPEPFQAHSLEHGTKGPQWVNFVDCRATLLAIGLTCRMLRTLSLPSLYQNILINEVEALLQLLPNLVRYPERGRFVRQITFVLQDAIPNDTQL